MSKFVCHVPAGELVDRALVVLTETFQRLKALSQVLKAEILGGQAYSALAKTLRLVNLVRNLPNRFVQFVEKYADRFEHGRKLPNDDDRFVQHSHCITPFLRIGLERCRHLDILALACLAHGDRKSTRLNS